jgi:hypothetical protein
MQEKADLFPSGVDEVISQASQAIVAALDGNLSRIRMQINTAEFDPKRSHESQSIMKFVNRGANAFSITTTFGFLLSNARSNLIDTKLVNIP